METIRHRFKMVIHNCISHPIAGVLWLAGWQAGGDWIHDNF